MTRSFPRRTNGWCRRQRVTVLQGASQLPAFLQSPGYCSWSAAAGGGAAERGPAARRLGGLALLRPLAVVRCDVRPMGRFRRACSRPGCPRAASFAARGCAAVAAGPMVQPCDGDKWEKRHGTVIREGSVIYKTTDRKLVVTEMGNNCEYNETGCSRGLPGVSALLICLERVTTYNFVS